MDDIDLFRAMSGRSSAASSASYGNTSTFVARAVSDSSDGAVFVVLPGESVTSDGGVAVPVKTTQRVVVGDPVQVTLANGSPVVTGVVGGGDRTQGSIDAARLLAEEAGSIASAAAGAAEGAAGVASSALESSSRLEESTSKAISEVKKSIGDIESLVWSDSEGVHVSTGGEGGELEGNVLVTALSVLVRYASTVLSSFSGSGVVVYDESGAPRLSVTKDGVLLIGDDGSTEVAHFAEDVQVGAADGKRVVVGDSGVVIMDGESVLGSFMPSAVTVGPADGLHASLTASGFGIYSGESMLSMFGPSTVQLGADSESAIVTMCAGIVAIKYASNRLGIGTSNKPIAMFTESGGYVNVHVNDDDPKNHGALYCADKYAGVFCGNGTDQALGSGAYVAVGMSGGKGYATIRADVLGLLPAGGTSQTNASMSHVAGVLADAKTVALGYGFTLTKSGGTVSCTSENRSISIPGGWGNIDLGTVPEGFRPPGWVVSPNIGNVLVYIEVTSDGAARVVNGNSYTYEGNLSMYACWTAAG